jgi:hypothetical protein
MAEELDLAHLSISDREDLKEVDHDRDAAFPAAAALADGSQDPIPWRLDELKRLRGEVDPGPSILLAELKEFRGAPKILWRVRVRLLVTPVGLDLRIENFRKSFPGEFTAHERVEVVESRAHDLDVLLRHRPRSISRDGVLPLEACPLKQGLESLLPGGALALLLPWDGCVGRLVMP